MKLGIQAALWILSIFFAYKIYDAISGPIKFNQINPKNVLIVNNKFTLQIQELNAA